MRESNIGPKRKSLVKGIVLVLVVALFLMSLAGKPITVEQGCPAVPVVDISNPQVPSDVCVPVGFGGNPIRFFDDYSWKSFIALVWPVQNGQRAVPDTTKNVDDAGPRVFETYKAQWEIFHNDGSAPAPWDQYDVTNACSANVGFGDLVLASFSKFSDLGQAGFGSLVGPLIEQNRTYVRFATAFNRTEFDQISQNKWYSRSVLDSTTSLTFKYGSLDIKSSWIDMENVPHPERYYSRTAIVMDPATGNCSPKTVGLVGLHIVQKTPTRPQWIWSTFEQVDNVPDQAGTSGTFNFNNGTPEPTPTTNPYPIDPLIVPVPTPFNVLRTKPIHPSTANTNAEYQAMLKAHNSVWQFYRLVMTQWPLTPSSPSTPGTPANTFPGTGTDQTAFSNTTMETFDQNRITTSCMACHNFTRTKTDFLWALNDHAWPANVPNFLLKNNPLKQLQTVLLEARAPSRSDLQKTTPKKKITQKKPN